MFCILMYDHNILGWNLLNMKGQTHDRREHGCCATRVIPCSSSIIMQERHPRSSFKEYNYDYIIAMETIFSKEADV